MRPESTTGFVSAAALRRRLVELEEERAAAVAWGVCASPPYMRDLDAEMAAVEAAYVGHAVTEIATLRAAMGGRLHG
jgi:hypothetical protein